MASPWSLQKELCGLAKARTIDEALKRLGLMEAPCSKATLEEVHGWTRSGSETFTYAFRLVLPDGAHELLLKAIVAFSLTRSLGELNNEWLRRREILASEGINTPTLHYAGKALLVEQFIPKKLSNYLKRHSSGTTRLVDQVLQLAAVLERHEFCPISPFNGLRTDGADVFVVNFGQDLGPPACAKRHDGRLLKEAIRWLEDTSGRPVDKRRAKAVYAFHAEPRHHAPNEGTTWS